MAISFPLALPGVPEFAKVDWTDNNIVGVAESPFTLSTQALDWQAGRWEATVTYPPVGDRATAAALEGFFGACRGRAASFLLPVPRKYRSPRGNPQGTPLVDGANQTGYVLNTKGWTPSALKVLCQADRFQLGSGATARVYKVLGVGALGDVNADGAGKAAIDIWPALRVSPGDGDALTLTNCVALFRLASNKFTFTLDELETWGFSFQAVEYL